MRQLKLWALMTLLGAAGIQAAPVETVSLTAGGGGTHQGAAGITAALAAVDGGGEVRILEAGAYEPISVDGKAVKITGAVDGVIIQGNATVGTAVTVGSTSGTTTVEIENVRAETAIAGAFRALQMNPGTNAFSLTATGCEFANTGDSNAIQLVAPDSAAGAVDFTFDGCDIRNAGGGTYNVTGGEDNITNFNGTFHNCHMEATTGNVITGDLGDGWNYQVTSSTLICALRPARTSVIRPNAGHNNVTFLVEDSVLVGTGELLIHHTSGTGTPMLGNRWIVNRCLLDNRRHFPDSPPNTNRPIHFRYNSSGGASATPFNVVEVYNSIVLTQTGVNAIRPGGNTIVTAYNNTFFNEGAAADQLAASSDVIGSTQDGADTLAAEHKFVNNLILNTGGILTGTGEASGNVHVTPGDDDADLGADRVYIQVAAPSSYAAVLTAAGLNDPSALEPPAIGSDVNIGGLIPNPGSVAVDAGVSTSTVLAAIGNVDFRSLVRGDGAPDAGAFELDAAPPVNNARGWVIFE